MKTITKKYKCCVCGCESEFVDYLSNFVVGYLDFDLKPVGSMMNIGENIKECPNCHYANYSIEQPIERRFFNNVELWNKDEEIQKIVKNYDNPLRKVLLVAKQFKNNNDYKNAYNSYVMASWLSEGENASNYRREACSIFAEQILPQYNNLMLQFADLLRMEGEFENSNSVLESLRYLIDDDSQEGKKIYKIMEAESKFIEVKDGERHNLKEVFGDKDKSSSNDVVE